MLTLGKKSRVLVYKQSCPIQKRWQTIQNLLVFKHLKTVQLQKPRKNEKIQTRTASRHATRKKDYALSTEARVCARSIKSIRKPVRPVKGQRSVSITL